MVDDSGLTSSSDDEDDPEEYIRLDSPPNLDETLPMPAPPGPLDPNAGLLETVRHEHDSPKYRITEKDRAIVTKTTPTRAPHSAKV